MEELVGSIFKLISLVVIIVVAVWGVTKFLRRDELFPRIQFDVDAEFVGFQDGKYLVQIHAYIDSKGIVPLKITELDFTLRGLKDGDKISDGDSIINGQIDIPSILKRGSWKHERWEYTFIYPGVRSKYTYLSAIPKNISFMLIHGKFIESLKPRP